MMMSRDTRGNFDVEPMETDGEPGSSRKVAKISHIKRPRQSNDVKTPFPGATSSNDVQKDMQVDEQDDNVSADMTSGTKSSRCLHNELVAFLQANLVPAMLEYRSFLTIVSSHLARFDLEETKEDIGLILKTLEDREIIAIGNYNVLLEILKDAKLNWLINGLESRTKNIHVAMVAEGDLIPPEYKASPGESRSSASLHSSLKEHIHEHLVPQMREYKSFLNNVKAYLPKGTVAYNKQTVVDILDILEDEDWIGTGNYDTLETILGDSMLKALQTDVVKRGRIIRQAMKEEGVAGKSVTQLPDVQEKKSSDRQHTEVSYHIGVHLDPDEYKSFLTIIRGVYLSQAEVEIHEDCAEILEALELKGVFCKGDYGNLIKILSDAHLNSLSVTVQKMQAHIRKTMLEEGLPIPELKSEAAGDKILGNMHNSLFELVNRKLSPQMQQFRSFLTLTRSYLSDAVLEANKESVTDILSALQRDEYILVGNYTVLLDILEGCSLLQLKTEIEEKECEIQGVMRKDGKEIPKITRNAVQEKKSSDQQHRDLIGHIDNHLDSTMSHYKSFVTAVKLYLPEGTLANTDGRVIDILGKLISENFIQKGNYQALLDILNDSKLLKLRSEAQKREEEIKQSMQEEGVPIEQVTSKPLESKRLHRQLLEKVHRNLGPKMPQYKSFQTNMRTHLDKGPVANNKNTAADLMAALEATNKLGVGNYEILLTVLHDSRLNRLKNEVRNDGAAIEVALKHEARNNRKTP